MSTGEHIEEEAPEGSDESAEADTETESVEDLEAAPIEEGAVDEATSLEEMERRAQSLDPDRVRSIVEGLLFVAERPVSVEQLHDATGIAEELLSSALESLHSSLAERGAGIVLHDLGGAWQLRTEPSTADYVRRFLRVRPQRLTRAALETLAIVAYRQPVTRPEIEDIRGVDCGAVLKALLDRRLLQILGKKDEVGRPLLYGTSREFLEFFALKDLAALPTLREFHELTEEHQALVDAQAKPTPKGTLAELADPAFAKRLEDEQRASEDALSELEEAMSYAEAQARAAAAAVSPPPSDPEQPEG